VLDLWLKLGAKTGEFFRLPSHNLPCQWPNDPRKQELPAHPFHQIPMDQKNDEQWS
jgi:hypothetical protein